MKTNTLKLTPSELKLLEQFYPKVVIPNTTDLVYENQIPTLGVILLKGKALITQKKKILQALGPGSIFGIEELSKNQSLTYGCKIQKNSSVILLQKSDILSLLREGFVFSSQSLLEKLIKIKN